MKRKKEIEKLVELYYNEYKVLQNKSIEILKKEIIDMFYNTNLSIDEIEEKLKEMVKAKNGKKTDAKKKDKKEQIYIITVLVALLIALVTISSILIR